MRRGVGGRENGPKVLVADEEKRRGVRPMKVRVGSRQSTEWFRGTSLRCVLGGGVRGEVGTKPEGGAPREGRE